MSDDMETEIINEMLTSGALEFAGYDKETNEPLYRITEKMEYVNKALFDEHKNNVHTDMMLLWEQRILDVDLTEENPIVKLTPRAFNEQAVSSLPDELKIALKEIKRVLLP
jgi:hypothetical protein